MDEQWEEEQKEWEWQAFQWAWQHRRERHCQRYGFLHHWGGLDGVQS